MVEDTISLFQRMLFEGFEIANDTFENDTQSQPGYDSPTKPSRFITTASWIYTKQMFPACQSLVSLLLEENHGDGIANIQEGLVAKLFGMLTTLLALECTATPSGDLISTGRQVVPTIIDSDEFFRYIRSYGKPQIESGPSLVEDLLLHDRPHCNKIGQAILAFINLQNQLHPSNDATMPFPSPLSAEHRWTLLFPHAITFLADEDASNIKLGFDMLQILVSAHFIRPIQCGTVYTNIAFQGAHSPELLAQTLHTLLSLVLRISALEATSPNSSSLEYSSLQVMNLAQSLKTLYSANSQVQAIAEISQKIRDSDQGLIALLPKVLDWLRPVIMDICNKCKDSFENSNDLILLCEVIKVFNPILAGLDEVFDDSTEMPKNIPSFFSMIEAYTALFSSLRAMKVFIHNNAPIDNSAESTHLSFISEWLTQSLDRLIAFKERLEKLIDTWSAETEASSPPPGHHRCLLLHYHLEEAVLELSGED
mmetsp:Transcript_12103/g.18596  ORF Transcript_12103/g.18596 Transcript_12103/m.18596 type:complete len:481 (+) Transcript_12103:3-1445(+)